MDIKKIIDAGCDRNIVIYDPDAKGVMTIKLIDSMIEHYAEYVPGIDPKCLIIPESFINYHIDQFGIYKGIKLILEQSNYTDYYISIGACFTYPRSKIVVMTDGNFNNPLLGYY